MANTYLLTIGPLEYQLIAHDSWGCQILAELTTYLDCSLAIDIEPDRIIHLYALPQGAANRKEKRKLPEQLESRLPAGHSGQLWNYRKDLVNTVWSSPETKHCFWTAGIAAEMGKFRYHLPWDLLLQDIELRKGGLIHGGLASHRGSAMLFMAPPGGGKSTTLSTAPKTWQVLSDDAALLWPDDAGIWKASPLPSWGMLNQVTAGPTASLRRLDRHVPLRAMTRIYQVTELCLTRLLPVKTAPLVYRSLCEYPGAFLSDPAYRIHYFRTAASLAKQVPCWRLDLPLGTAVWPQLEQLLEQITR